MRGIHRLRRPRARGIPRVRGIHRLRRPRARGIPRVRGIHRLRRPRALGIPRARRPREQAAGASASATWRRRPACPSPPSPTPCAARARSPRPPATGYAAPRRNWATAPTPSPAAWSPDAPASSASRRPGSAGPDGQQGARTKTGAYLPFAQRFERDLGAVIAGPHASLELRSRGRQASIGSRCSRVTPSQRGPAAGRDARGVRGASESGDREGGEGAAQGVRGRHHSPAENTRAPVLLVAEAGALRCAECGRVRSGTARSPRWTSSTRRLRPASRGRGS